MDIRVIGISANLYTKANRAHRGFGQVSMITLINDKIIKRW